MWHATWNRLLQSRRRLALTAVAVAIGVTLLTGALVLTDSTRSALDDSYAQVYAGVDLVVRGPDGVGESPFAGGASPLPRSATERIRAVPGVAGLEGRVSTVAQINAGGADEHGESAIAMAVPVDPANAAIGVRSGRLPARAGEVAVDAAAAEALGVQPGDRVEVLLPDGPVAATVSGVVGFGRLDGLAGGTRVLFDRGTAAERFGGAGYAEVLVHADGGVTPDELRGRLASSLDEHAQVLTASEAAARDAAAASRQTALVSRVVLAVAVVALLIGGFLIANTFRILVGQRTRELALLRAVGASRRQVAGSVFAEAAITGTAGSALGVALGLGAGVLLVSASSGLMPGLPPTSPTLTPVPVVAGLVVGVSVAMLAGRGAVRRAVRVPPVAAMRMESSPEVAVSRTRLLLGGALLAGGLTAVGSNAVSGTPPVLVGAVIVVLAAGVLFSAATRLVLAVLSRLIERAGVTGSLARQQILAAPRRAAATAAALAVTLGLVSFLLVMNASLGAATPGLLAARQHAELTVRSTARPGLHDALLTIPEQLEQLAEVATARAVTYGDARVTDPAGDEPRPRTVSLYIVDPAAVGDLFDVRSQAGDVADLGAGEVAVREAVAAASGWRQGQRLQAEFPDGSTASLTVAALFDGTIGADWIAAPEAAAHQTNAYREVFVRLAEGVSVTAATPLIEGVVERVPSALLLSRDDQALETAEANSSALGILTALFALSLPIGILGVANTLSLAVTERIRELALLRAVGATRGQVRATIRWEALLTSTVGAVLGATLGLFLAWVATKAMPGESLPLSIPVVHLGIAVIATALLGVVAALLPALRASRLDVLRALQAA